MLHSVNHAFLEARVPDCIEVDIVKVEQVHDVEQHGQDAEIDEMWSYVGCKANQRWLWGMPSIE